MPQISKIRIVNFTYNDGNRLIADELFDFADAENKKALNTLINLKNGGGKSVLVQLMLQPIHPKAKTNDRKIESFFTSAKDHCFVVIEWFKDNSDEKLMTGIAMASGDSSNSEEGMGHPVNYYTFLSNYRDYSGKFNIISLPLSKKENGSFVAASYDEIRKFSKGNDDKITLYSSDRSKDWRDILADYGIIQEEWTYIVEKVNSVEGGMTKFFEGYRDSKQLLDRLLIPTIEGKFAQSNGKEDASLGTMLLDHSKAYLHQKDLIEERKICDEFVLSLNEINEMTEKTWNINDIFEKQLQLLTAFRNKLKDEAERLDANTKDIETELQKIKSEMIQVEYEKASENYYIAKDQFETAQQEYKRVKELFDKTEEELDKASRTTLIYKCAKLYHSLQEIQGKLTAIQSSIREKTIGNEITKRINSVAYTVNQITTELKNNATEELRKKKEEQSLKLDEKQKLEKEKKETERAYEQTKSEYERKKEAHRIATIETDKLVTDLEIECNRYLDGNYHADEFEKAKAIKDSELKKINTWLEKERKEIGKLKNRNEQIGKEYIEINNRKSELEQDKKRLIEEQQIFLEAFEKAKELCVLYNLSEQAIFDGNLNQIINQTIDDKDAEKINLRLQLNVIQEEIEAAERGTIHVSKEVVEFLENRGIEYQSCESYLSSLMTKSENSRNEILNLLSRYPEVAFGIILDDKKYDLIRFNDRNDYEWLPALVPIFSHEQLDEMLKTGESQYTTLSFYSEAYFSNPSSFVLNLNNRKSELEEKQGNLNIMYDKLLDESKIACSLGKYSSSTEEEFNTSINNAANEIVKIHDDCINLDAEKEENKSKIEAKEAEIENKRTEINAIENWFSKYAELLTRLEKEILAFDSMDKAYIEQKRQNDENERVNREYESCEKEVNNISNQVSNTESKIDEFTNILDEIGECEPAENVEGNLETLYEEYKKLKDSFGKELETLQEQERIYLDQKNEKEKDLAEYQIPENEYVRVEFSEAVLRDNIEKQNQLEKSKKDINNQVIETNGEMVRCEVSMNNSITELGNYGGTALAKEQIKGNYSQRKRSINNSQSLLEQKEKKLQKRISEIELTESQASSLLENYGELIASVEIELEDNLKDQYGRIRKQLISCSKQLEESRDRLIDEVRKHKNKSIYRIDEAQIFDRFENFIKSKDVKGDRYFMLTEQIGTVIQTTLLRASQIDTDLNDFNQSRTNLLRHCVLQGKRIYDGLRSMSKNSLISYAEGKGKRQMLRINIPDSIDAGVAEMTVAREIDKGIQEVVNLISMDASEADIMRTVNRIVSSPTLFRRYVNADNISVEVFKIDINPENAKYRTWELTQVNNSGGEKLVLYFAVILSLMNYSRSEYGDSQDKNLTSVLFLDNPFGPVSSEHLLKPMFNIAKHFNVQLICLSDLNKTEITNCFETFIKAKVETLKYSNKEMLTHEGNEKIEHGFYRSEQMSFVL